MQNNVTEFYYKCIPNVFFIGNPPPSGPGPPHFQGVTITLRHTVVGRTALDE